MGLFSDIQDAARREARQARLQAGQARPVEKAAALRQDTQPQEHQPSAKEDPARETLTMQAGSEPVPPVPAPEPELPTPAPEPEATTQPEPEAPKQAAPEQPPVTPMSDGEAVAASTKRIQAEIERITRKNMKDCVAEHLQERCAKDPVFARAVIQPKKSMVNCFRYINKKAEAYAKQEREDNGITENGVYGCDVPDDLVYQWAVDYFNDPDADKEPAKKAPQKTAATTTSKTKRTPATPAQPKVPPTPVGGAFEQMSLMG